MPAVNEPANTVVVSPNGATSIREGYIESATNMYAKRLVMQGTDKNDIIVCTENSMPEGVLGWEDCNDYYKPALIGTIYVILDRAPVISGPGTIVQCTLATSQTITMNEPLIAGADGLVQTAAVLTIDSGGTAVTSTAANGAIISGDIGDAQVIGYAQETVTTTGSTADIMVKLTF